MNSTIEYTSVFPIGPRYVRPDTISEHLGESMGWNRHEHTFDDSARKFFDKYSIDVDSVTFEVFMDDVWKAVMADKVYDSEENQAVRACIPAVRQWIARPVVGLVEATGYFPGEYITMTFNGWVYRFCLTGGVCPQCEVNPLAHGDTGSGIQCVDRAVCRYLFCY